MEIPHREIEHEHQCACDLIVQKNNGDGSLVDVHDRCMQSVFNPDQPICDDCEAAGHADLPRFVLSN